MPAFHTDEAVRQVIRRRNLVGYKQGERVIIAIGKAEMGGDVEAFAQSLRRLRKEALGDAAVASFAVSSTRARILVVTTPEAFEAVKSVSLAPASNPKSDCLTAG
jgi:hypothetical protein